MLKNDLEMRIILITKIMRKTLVFSARNERMHRKRRTSEHQELTDGKIRLKKGTYKLECKNRRTLIS